MRFRFCGDLDCPDWVLAEISTLSKVTSVKMKLLCLQVMNDLLGHQIDYEKVIRLTADAKYEVADIKSAVAALNFIFSRAGKFSVEGETLSNELQQLGLPKEHAVALCKVYEDKLSDLQKAFRDNSIRLSKLESADWRVDFVISSSMLSDVNEPEIQLKIRKTEIDGCSEATSFTVSGDKFRVLLAELKKAHQMMESASY